MVLASMSGSRAPKSYGSGGRVYSATVSLLVGFRKMSRTAAGGHHADRRRIADLSRAPNPPAQGTTSGSNRSNGWKPLAERSRKSTESPRIEVRSHDHRRSTLRGHE